MPCTTHNIVAKSDGSTESVVDTSLMEEWNQLVKREYELDVALESVVNAVYDSHTDAGIARVIQQDIYRINGKMPLATQLMLKRLRGHAEKLIHSIDVEVCIAKQQIQLELRNIEKKLCEIEPKIKAQKKRIIEAAA